MDLKDIIKVISIYVWIELTRWALTEKLIQSVEGIFSATHKSSSKKSEKNWSAFVNSREGTVLSPHEIQSTFESFSKLGQS